MLFAIDIDRTIAGGFKAYVEHHNQDLELGIPPHVLEDLTGYQSFLHLPEVIAYRRKNEARFQESRASCRVSPKVIRSLGEIPGAVEGVMYLSQLGTIRYYTIRSHEVQEGTREWLSTKRFPNPHAHIPQFFREFRREAILYCRVINKLYIASPLSKRFCEKCECKLRNVGS